MYPRLNDAILVSMTSKTSVFLCHSFIPAPLYLCIYLLTVYVDL